jgi:hypothetical protein
MGSGARKSGGPGQELAALSEEALQRADEAGRAIEKHVVRAMRLQVEASTAVAGKARRAGEAELKKVEEASGLSQEQAVWAAVLPVFTVAMLLLSRFFPPLTAVFFGSKLYTPAWFQYDSKPRFDDTVLTYGTDYGIFVVMGVCTVLLLQVRQTPENRKLVLASALLIGSYALSTGAGALCHHVLAKNLNSAAFRFWWRLCVGCVAAGGGLMGSAASEIAGMAQLRTVAASEEAEAEAEAEPGSPAPTPAPAPAQGGEPEATELNYRLPVVPHFFWAAYGAAILVANTVGFFSMKQPACDIFCVGVSQAPSTMYLIAALYARKDWGAMGVRRRARRVLLIGALANIVLLPAYDFANFLRLPLGVINLALHTTLLASWGSQAYGLLHFARGAALASKHD